MTILFYRLRGSLSVRHGSDKHNTKYRVSARMIFLASFVLTFVASPSFAAAKNACGAGTDYGSGMVASVLSDEAGRALAEAHTAILEQAPTLQSDYLQKAPYAPHVSIIYDITEPRTTPAQKALHAFLQTSHSDELSFGSLKYWDDAKGGRTTLVVAINEAKHTLTKLHDSIAQATQIKSRFAYNPHVTLAYLKAGARLPETLEAGIKTKLSAPHWQPRRYFVTNQCGEHVIEESLD